MEKVLYDEYVSKIKDCLDYYEENKIYENIYKLKLPSNKKSISYWIFSKNIPHILGININFLRKNHFVSDGPAVNAIREFLKKRNDIFKCLNGQVEEIFSSDIKEKLSIFKKNIDLNFHAIDFVVEIDHEKRIISDTNFSFVKADYAIVRYFEEENIYSLLFLVQNGKYFSLMSSQGGQDISHYAKYLIKQNCYIPDYGLVVSPKEKNEQKFEFSLQQKQDKLNFLRSLKQKYNISICVDEEYNDLLNYAIPELYHEESIRILLDCLLDNDKLWTYDELASKIQDDEIIEQFSPLLLKLKEEYDLKLEMWLELKKEKERNLSLEKQKEKNALEYLQNLNPSEKEWLRDCLNLILSNKRVSNAYKIACFDGDFSKFLKLKDFSLKFLEKLKPSEREWLRDCLTLIIENKNVRNAYKIACYDKDYSLFLERKDVQKLSKKMG